MEQTLIRLKVAKKADNGFFFKEGSIGQVVGGTLGKEIDFMPVLAWDEKNLPYHALNEVKFYSFALKNDEFTLEKEMPKIPKYALNYPGSYLEGPEFDVVTSILEEAYAEKDYSIDRDGNIKKKAGLKYAFENHQTPTNEQVTTKYPGDGVAGEDDPGIKDNYEEEVSEHPAEKPILGPLARKIQSFLTTLGTIYPNNLGKNVSWSFDTNIGGSGRVKNCYSEEVSEHKATKPILGPLKGKLDRIRESLRKYSQMKKIAASTEEWLEALKTGKIYREKLIDDVTEHVSTLKRELSYADYVDYGYPEEVWNINDEDLANFVGEDVFDYDITEYLKNSE